MDHPVTAAVRVLRQQGVAFEPHQFPYIEKGGTAHSATALGVDEHAVVKTLIMEDDAKKPLCVLMHGDREVSTKFNDAASIYTNLFNARVRGFHPAAARGAGEVLSGDGSIGRQAQSEIRSIQAS